MLLSLIVFPSVVDCFFLSNGIDDNVLSLRYKVISMTLTISFAPPPPPLPCAPCSLMLYYIKSRSGSDGTRFQSLLMTAMIFA